MKFLLLNQTFYPDVMATGQYLTELALYLVEHGHEVTVVTSRRAYDSPEQLFAPKETWRGIQIIRIASTGFGKSARWKRAADFASFLAMCALRLVFLPRHDVIVGLTSPPLISFLGAWLARLRHARFIYWVMDFNPDEAIAAGWLRPGSLIAGVLEMMSRFSLRQATRVVALDRFMRNRIVAKGIPVEKIAVVPPWSHEGDVKFDMGGRESFREARGLKDKFVVMYSGNHSPCHPLNTLLTAAEKMIGEPEVVFCFIGGGSEWRRIQEQMQERKKKGQCFISNVICLPYEPLAKLSASLSAADLHVVVMGDGFVGLVHPCKIYNILTVAAPLLYIGPEPSHLSEIIHDLNGKYLCASATHGDVEGVVKAINRMRAQRQNVHRQAPAPVLECFSQRTILPKLVDILKGQ